MSDNNNKFRSPSETTAERMKKPVDKRIYLTNKEHAILDREKNDLSALTFIFVEKSHQYSRYDKKAKDTDMASTEYRLKSDKIAIFKNKQKVWSGTKNQFKPSDNNSEGAIENFKSSNTSWSNNTNLYCIALDEKTGDSFAVQIVLTPSGSRHLQNTMKDGQLSQSPFKILIRETTEQEREDNNTGNHITDFLPHLSNDFDYLPFCEKGDELLNDLKAYFSERGLKFAEKVGKSGDDDTPPNFDNILVPEGAETLKSDDLPF